MTPRSSLKTKIKRNIKIKLLNTFTDFLDNRTQSVILNGQYYSWVKVEARVYQGSVLRPLLFLIYMNDLSENLASNSNLIADDTSLFSMVKNIEASGV